MLLKKFYTILKKNVTESNDLEWQIHLNAEHKLYRGHFPKQQIVPGVAMLQILKEIIEDHFETTVLLSEASSIKFTQPVDPYRQPILNFMIQCTVEKDHIKVKNQTSFPDGTAVLKCNVTFVKK